MTKTEAVKVAVNQATLKRERIAVVTHSSVTSDIGADHDALPLSQVEKNPAYVVRAVAWPDGGVDYQPKT